ncbi:MAG: cell division protein ZapA [Clostridia bacterium]|nr:cell division protein ZapA [Clostridia bacterium]MBR2908553.1 cell division protein ZapA [Clostridia bacterium]
MKQRYTLTIADMELNVISDESPETVESLVGSVDRKMREILTTSRRCNKSEAALLCALDYCSDKVQALRKVKQQEAVIDEKNTLIHNLEKENDKLRVELETLRESLVAMQSLKNEQILSAEPVEEKKPKEELLVIGEPEQLTITEPEEEAPVTEEAAPDTTEAPTEPEKAPIEPEDVEFDPTEIFRRAKANRSFRKNGKRK